MTGIDLFAGAGGFSLGAEQAGINALLAIERDKDAHETYLANFGCGWNLDIRDVDTDWISTKDIIFGGCPCQSFSRLNTRTRNTDNPNANLFLEFVRFVKDIKPKWFVFENVPALMTFNKGETMREICACFRVLGYVLDIKVLDAYNYYVPQKRCRLFIIGNKENIAPIDIKKYPVKKWVSDAFDELPELKNGVFYGLYGF
jgi:DNA (cytosine-5)-methyltransferase 1